MNEQVKRIRDEVERLIEVYRSNPNVGYVNVIRLLHYILEFIDFLPTKQELESIEALRMEYEKGRHDMREEMMKDAEDGFLSLTSKYITTDGTYAKFGIVNPKRNYEDYDKVKLIIIKEDKQ